MNPESESATEENLTADVIHLSGGNIGAISADAVQIERGGASRIVATDVGIRQGVAGMVEAETVGMSQSWSMAVRGTHVGIEGGGAGVVMGGDIGMVRSRAGLTVADRAQLNDSNTFILLAREVSGSVETVLDTRGAVAAGLVAGMAIGLVLFVGGILSRRRS